MDTLHARISPKAAVAAGFQLFRELFAGARTSHVLLEGLDYVEHEDAWHVRIGFDAGRNKETGGAFANAGIGQKTVEPLREYRSFYLNATTGDFIRVEGA